MLAVNEKKLGELSASMVRFQMNLEEVMYRLWNLRSEMSEDVILNGYKEGIEVCEAVEQCSQKLRRACQIGEALSGILPIVREVYVDGVNSSE